VPAEPRRTTSETVEKKGVVTHGDDPQALRLVLAAGNVEAEGSGVSLGKRAGTTAAQVRERAAADESDRMIGARVLQVPSALHAASHRTPHP
jgi:hypothetical protein